MAICGMFAVVEELHSLLKPYLLRRTKSGVLKDLPEKSDVVLYHGLSKLQKKLYKAILMKDIGETVLEIVRKITCVHGVDPVCGCADDCLWKGQNQNQLSQDNQVFMFSVICISLQRSRLY